MVKLFYKNKTIKLRAQIVMQLTMAAELLIVVAADVLEIELPLLVVAAADVLEIELPLLVVVAADRLLETELPPVPPLAVPDVLVVGAVVPVGSLIGVGLPATNFSEIELVASNEFKRN